jgi:hypothetical protein
MKKTPPWYDLLVLFNFPFRVRSFTATNDSPNVLGKNRKTRKPHFFFLGPEATEVMEEVPRQCKTEEVDRVFVPGMCGAK